MDEAAELTGYLPADVMSQSSVMRMPRCQGADTVTNAKRVRACQRPHGVWECLQYTELSANSNLLEGRRKRTNVEFLMHFPFVCDSCKHAFTLNRKYIQTLRRIVLQKPAYLSLLRSKIFFFSKYVRASPGSK